MTATFTTSSVFLAVICALFIIISFLLNFTFLITLLKLRRLNKTEKSNFLLTHLILIDFVCAFFVLIPSGYGIYNNGLGLNACHLQLFFITFFFSSTFYGLFALSVERFFKYKYPISHINIFTKRVKKLTDGSTETKSQRKYAAFLIIIILWILNIFISFIPMIGNYNNVQYFQTESQCDYQYEACIWWLWFYFWFSIILPFFGSIIFYLLTLRLIIINAKIINARQNIIRNKNSQKEINITAGKYLVDMIFSCVTRSKKIAESNVKSANLMKINRRGISDTTQLPENCIFYSHIINIQNLEDDQYANDNNDLHVRKNLLIQFKYDTERSKTMTFFLITIIDFCLVFPIFAIHFYRTYNYDPTYGSYDNPNVISFSTYTTFVWISYITFIIKSFVCLFHNKFYRYSLYQSANCRGFHGIFEYQLKRLEEDLKKLESALDLDSDTKNMTDRRASETNA